MTGAAAPVTVYGTNSTRKTDSVLSLRELEIARLFVEEGYDIKDVARTLDLSVKTVETHRANIMRKLGQLGLPRGHSCGPIAMAIYCIVHGLVDMRKIELKYQLEIPSPS